MDRFKDDKYDDDISLKFKIGVVVLIVATLFQLIGMASSHWALTQTTEFGTVQYSGLWEKCNDLSIGMKQFECQGFVWEDVQVSHWFRTIQTMEALGMVGMFVVILLVALYLFTQLRGRKSMKAVILGVIFLSGVLIVTSCIIFGSLKNVMKARQMPEATVALSWSFAFSLIGGLGCFGCGVMLAIG